MMDAFDAIRQDRWSSASVPITVELSRQAAVFLCATVRAMNQRKILPPDNRAALETSAWLEEIEAKLEASLWGRSER